MKFAALFILFTIPADAQQYPRWFLEQEQIPCRTKIVSVLRAPSLYRDSAVALAFRKGCDLLAKYTAVTIRGGQAFWTTEAGVHSMGAQYVEEYDTSLSDRYQSTLKVIDTFVDKQKTIVLAVDSAACRMNEDVKEIIPINAIPQPAWVEKLPNNSQYHFGVGSSEEYFYESSSWERAEQNALMSLARSNRTTVVSIQKKSAFESQEVFNEELDVPLQHVEIVARWRDIKKKIFYVLARTQR